MPSFDHHEDPDLSLSSPYEHNNLLPGRPRLAARPAYSYERRPSSRHLETATSTRSPRRGDQVQDDREQSSPSRERQSKSPRKEKRGNRPDSQVRNASREERRRKRAAQDPEREARRQERRAARDQAQPRASRQERAARDPDDEARRAERREARRAERRASRSLGPEQRAAAIPSQLTPQTSSNNEEDIEDQPEPGRPVPIGNVADDSSALDSAAPTHWLEPFSKAPAYAPVQPDEYDHEYSPERRPGGRTPSRYYHEYTPETRPDSKTPSRRLARGDSWYSSQDTWNADLESSSLDEKKHHSSQYSSSYDELNYFKRRRQPRAYELRDDGRRRCCGCGRKCIIGIVVAVIIVLVIVIAVPVAVSRNNNFNYTPSYAQVNNTAAFTTGGATRDSVNSTKDGIGAGTDSYTYYHGQASSFPNNSLWISFDDMWNNNLASIKQACGWLDYGANDSPDEIQDMYNAIQNRANASLVDHRFILAIVLQESHGCVRNPPTKSSGGVHNTGLMQAHNGHEYNSHHQQKSILLMVQDGTQGTKHGWGLVDNLNTYGDPYKAARGYNSGYIPSSGDLSEAAGATACYVSDVANRLTGWVNAKSKCPTDS